MGVYVKVYSDELAHHGIKGMKWGVRRFQNKDGTRTAAGKKRYAEDKKTTNESPDEEASVKRAEKKGLKLTDKQKKYIKIGAAVVVASYATYKFIDSGSANRLITKGRVAVEGSYTPFKMNPKLANKNMDADEIFSSVVKRINPDYGDIGTKMNCRRCTFAYEMSRRGYDVKATRSVRGTGQNVVGLSSAVSKGKGLGNYFKEAMNDDSITNLAVLKGKTLGSKPVIKPSSDSNFAESIFKSLGEYENGARGELGVKWSCGGGHSMAWEIIKGKPVIFDCQTGEKYDTPELFKELGAVISDASSTRLDNIQLNNDFLLKWVKNV